MDHLQMAIAELNKGFTCVACNGEKVLSSQLRGVAPLLGWLQDGLFLADYAVADKVVGKGAAFLYLLLQVKCLHAAVISAPALELLRREHIAVTYDECVPAIRNRDNTGFCPIETAVLDCTDANEALKRIYTRLEKLKNKETKR